MDNRDPIAHRSPRRLPLLLVAVVVGAASIVHLPLPTEEASAEPRKPSRQTAPAKPLSEISNASLPRQVAEMRDAILAAVTSGKLEDLRLAIEMSETPPDLGQSAGQDPIEHLRSLSKSFSPLPAATEPAGPAPGADKAPSLAAEREVTPPAPPLPAGALPLPAFVQTPDGRDILEQIGKTLAARPALVAAGRDFENNGIYVWPALAARDWNKPPTAAEAAELEQFSGKEAATAMARSNGWRGWRLAIGAEGTWHALTWHE